MHASHEILEVHFDCTGSQNLLGRSGCFPRLRSRCGAVHIFGLGDRFLPFRFKRKGNLMLWWSKVDFAWQVQEIRLALF